jgi:hypothetical protein
MLRRSLFLLSIFATGICLSIGSLGLHAQDTAKRGRKYKPPPPTARVEVTVIRDVNGKPIENAAVIFHMVGDKGNMELKSNEDGKAVIEVLVLGSKVELQVIAKGFQTYGDDFKLDKPSMAFEVKMKRPGEQYSIYKDHGEKADAAKDAAPGAASAPAQAPPVDKPAVPAK